jgi:hypothetical protein
MARQERVGLLRGLLRKLAGVLKRALLGKSGHDYMQQFTGGGAHTGWPRDAGLCPGAGAPDPTPGPPGSEEEPVHGWTRRQLADYLARNPGYRATYQAALQKHADAAPATRRSHHVNAL